MRNRIALAAFAVLACTGLAKADANMVNPYDTWKDHKPGTTVVMTGNTEAAGMKTEMEQTYTLKAVTPEKATVEVATVMTVMGNKNAAPAQTMEIPAKAPEQPKTTPDGKPIDIQTSDETVTVAGKEYKAKVHTAKTEQQGVKATAKTWTSAEITGGTLKAVITTEGQMASTTTMEVTKVDVK